MGIRSAAIAFLLVTPWAADAASVLCTDQSEATQRRNQRGQARGRTGGSRKKRDAKLFARRHGRRMKRGR